MSSRNTVTPQPCSTLRRVLPSTPAVRDPRLRLIRSQAIRSVWRWYTRLKRSPYLRCSSSLVHRCSFRWTSSTHCSASSRLGHGLSLFNDNSSHPVEAAARCPPLPCGRLSRPPTTTRAPPPKAPADHGPFAAEPRRRQGVPTFTLFRSLGEVPSYTPAGRAMAHHSAATAADFRRQSAPNPPKTRSCLPRAHIHQV